MRALRMLHLSAETQTGGTAAQKDCFTASITHHSNPQYHRGTGDLNYVDRRKWLGPLQQARLMQPGTGYQLLPVFVAAPSVSAPGDLLTQTLLLWATAANHCQLLWLHPRREDGGGIGKAEESWSCSTGCWESHKGCLES